jgi:hypothetical protein
MTSANPANSSEPFPFMKLPLEIRLTIYELAMQDTIATAFSVPSSQLDVMEPSKPRLGALALAYTSDLVRKESSEAIYRIADEQLRVSLARQSSLWKAWCCLLVSSDGVSSMDEVKSKTWSRYTDALIKMHWIGRLCDVLGRAL